MALVHGTGNQTDAYNDYWQSDMVEGVRNGLTDRNNLLVVNCDFDQYMWDDRAAGCLAGQLTSFIQNRHIDRLIVITHSNGGNVMRWILSNPTWDARYPDIIQHIVKVDAIAPSSAGTPLADAVIAGNVFEVRAGLAARLQERRRAPAAAGLDGHLQPAVPARHQSAAPRCRWRSATWSAPMWSPASGPARPIAAATPRASAWRSPRTG